MSATTDRRSDRPELALPSAAGLPFNSARIEHRLERLMVARLALTLLGFALALTLDGLGLRPGLSATARSGLYWTLAFAFFATALAGLSFRYFRNAWRFATFQMAVDVTVVSSLVFFSGGHDSVFTFLFVAVAAYGAAILERRGAALTSTGCALAYGLVLLAERSEWAGGWIHAAPPVHVAVALATWAVHVGAFFLVGALCSVLTSELRLTGAELERSAHDLDRLRNLNASIVQSLESGLLTTDAEGRIGSFNPEAERITGVSADQAIGQLVDTLLPGAWELLTAPPGEGLESVRRTRLSYSDARGGARSLGLASSVLRDADGTALGHVLIFQDVTSVVEMEIELRRSERLAAVGEMASKIAHEIRNPLAAISGSLQMLSSDAEQTSRGDEPARLMNIVVREADRLSGLITDFLDYARPKPVRREAVLLDALVGDVAEMIRNALAENVELETECEPGLLAHADPDQLRQLLWNLCVNGMQAMPDGGRLSIGARTAAKSAQAACAEGRSGETDPCASGLASEQDRALGGVEIFVADTGEGIEDELVERLFEPFFTTKHRGTGLGLATVHRIVEAHSGQLTLDTEVGQGTRFRVWLPRAEGGA